MSVLEDFALFFVGVAILLTAFLIARAQRRNQEWPDERQWPGHGIEAGDLRQHLDQVRHDYTSFRRAPPRQGAAHRAFVNAAAASAQMMSYFRTKTRDTPTEQVQPPANEGPSSTPLNLWCA